MVSLRAGDDALTICGEWPTVGSGAGFTCNQQMQIGRFSKEQFGFAVYGKDDGSPSHGLRAGLGVHDDVPSLDLLGKDSEGASLTLAAPGPNLNLSGKGGSLIFATSLSANRTTSKPSIVLFDEGKNVLWSAP